MREYETIYVLRPDMTEQEEAAIHGRLAEVITREKAHLLKQSIWGKRKLAYEIRNYNKGVYVSLKYLADSAVVQELERNLKIIEPVIRFGTFKVGEVEDIQERIARQAKEDEEEAARRAERQRIEEAGEAEGEGAEEQEGELAAGESAAGEAPEAGEEWSEENEEPAGGEEEEEK